MAILQATPERQLGITVLNKALFYADLCALRDLGETITRTGYVALPQGPVLNHYERSLVKKLDVLRLAEQVREGWEKPLIVRKELETFTLLSPDEVGIAQLVARRIHSKTATWVSEYSHENEAWQLAFRQKTGAPISMTIAMQQVLEDDPWVDAEPDEIFRSVIAAAEHETGVPF
ncbi:MAG: Panacea domain-containing protein [Planctomycetota bacterium]